MRCKHCQTMMELIGQETSQQSMSERYRCPICRSEHLHSKLILNDQPFSLDPFVNYATAQSVRTKADDGQNFQLRQVEFK